jgi:hypothetical protein
MFLNNEGVVHVAFNRDTGNILILSVVEHVVNVARVKIRALATWG